MTSVIDRLSRAVASHRLPCGAEDRFQAALAKIFEREGLRFEREVDLGRGCRIDFVVEGSIGVEAKVEGSQTTVARQLRDYASRPGVSMVVLITCRAQHALYMPQEFGGKPIVVLLATGGCL